MESYRFPESDWKLLRSIQNKALVKACEQVFLAVETITEKRTSREHEAYLELWDLIKEKDREIANTFNNISRNTAIHSLVNIIAYGYLSKEDLGKFTVETQEKVLFMTQDRR